MRKGLGSKERFSHIEQSEGKTPCQLTPELGQLLIPASEECWHNLLAGQGAFWDHKELQDVLLSATPLSMALVWALKMEMVPEKSLLSFIYVLNLDIPPKQRVMNLLCAHIRIMQLLLV